MFVEPSYAKYLSNSGVAAALGKRPEILDTAGRLKDETKEEGKKEEVIKSA
jgi:hypothetical protein